MAEVTKKRTGEFMRALFTILLAEPEGLAARTALERLRSKLTLSPYEAGDYDSGGNRFEKIVRFATVDCVKAGWLIKNNGIWSVTEAGAQAYHGLPDPEAFYRQACKLYKVWRASQITSEPETDEEPEDPVSNKALAVTFEQASETAHAEIAQRLATMPPYEFQKLVAGLLKAMGYHIAWDAPPGKDGGVDILAWSDPLGTQSPRLKVQVKRQQASVAVDGLRAFLAVLGDGDVGLFVALGGFTKDAETEARLHQSRRLTLIDMRRFLELWIEHYQRLSDEFRQKLPLRPIYFLAPID
ncbi:MAG: Mrr restriction system protein [Sphingobacteriales bacterium]|nr:MAG: Mrr restriction system protein [Sphingobacteriales bacterium]